MHKYIWVCELNSYRDIRDSLIYGHTYRDEYIAIAAKLI